MQEVAENFICGFSYGVTNVVVGQPLDTIKIRLQTLPQSSSLQFIRQEGLPGLYRGGASLIVGGALMRSAQFGVYNSLLSRFKASSYAEHPLLSQRWLGIVDPLGGAAGFFGGVRRGLVEGPFEYVKVRRQVAQPWHLKEIFLGSGATVFRNAFLFSAFVIYIDASKQLVPGGLGAFWTGAICSNLAWLTIWPLDVVKSQLQSGNYQGKSFFFLLKDVIKTGRLFQGIVPGLTRSFIANGCSMVAYQKTEDFFKDRRLLKEKAATL